MLPGFGKGGFTDVVPLGPGGVGGEGAVFAAYFCASLLDLSAWSKVAVDYVRMKDNLREGKRTHKLARRYSSIGSL